jgi:macrolide-specific efflux system membrane fusion protein
MTFIAWSLALTIILADSAGGPAAGPIEVPAALVKLMDQVDVPAREAGVLSAVEMREGQIVKEGDLIAQVMDVEARIAEERAKIEVDIARKTTENDVKLRFARKSAEVAKAELRRSMASVDKYKKSVSDTDLERMQLVVDKSLLEIEQAEHEFQVALLTRDVKENEYQAAQEAVKRNRIFAPLSGVVVSVTKHRGEWVKPGDTVGRILRLDRLKAEGFLKVEHLTRSVDGCPVKLIVDLPGSPATEFPGKVMFLHPEIDPVNAQIRVWAEILNDGFRLRPGMRAKMLIETPQPPKTEKKEKG